jgi:hypothetical protein
MPPENNTSPGQNQPASPNVVNPTPQGVVVGFGSSLPDEVPPAKPESKKRPLFVIVGLVLLAVVVLAAVFFYVLPTKSAQKFTLASTGILYELSDEMAELHDDNFVKAKDITTSYDAAKRALAGRIADLSNTKKITKELESEYKTLKPTKKNTAEKEKLDKAFALAADIQRKYQASLDFRQATFDAYDDLPNKLDSYAKNYAEGGLRTDFMAQTQVITHRASAALETLSKLKVENDDRALYELRLEYLEINKETFSTLNQYYRSSAMPDKISQEIAAFSKKNVALNASIKAEIDKYVARSSIAKDFESFDELVGS